MKKEDEIDAAWRESTAIHLRRGWQLTPELRDRLAEAQNWRCCYCTERMEGKGKEPTAPTFEYVIHDGPHTIDNIAVACNRCNVLRDRLIMKRWAEKFRKLRYEGKLAA